MGRRPRRPDAADGGADRHLNHNPSGQNGGQTDVVRNIVGATASLVGQPFLAQLVLHAALELNVDVAYVSEVAEASVIERVVATSDPGVLGVAKTFRTEDTPAGEVIRSNNVYFCGDLVANRFPNDRWLQEQDMRSFLGVPLVGADQLLLGQMAVLSRQPIHESLSIESTVRALAPRIAGELERHRAEQQVRRSERMFRLLAERAADILFHVDLRPEPHFEYISPSVQELTGYAPQDFYSDWRLANHIIQPDDRPAVFNTDTGTEKFRETIRWIHRDGHLVYGEYVAIPLRDPQGEIVAIEGIVRDVTPRINLEDALRESEARQHAVIEALPDMVFRIDRAGFYREYIPAEGATPYATPEVFIGRSIAEILPEEVAVVCLRSIHAALNEGERKKVEYSLVEDGNEHFYEARIVPIEDDEVLAFVREFTAERHMRREVERREERAELEGKVERQIARRNPYGLTFREFTVLHHVAAGAADKEIAEALGISTFTVNKHVAAILSKMDAPSRTAAGVRAFREDLLS
jgi:PAS domain S-box-containing protein